MGGNDYKTKSSLSSKDESIAGPMFDIFKSGLSKGLSPYPGSGQSPGFNQTAVNQNFRTQIDQPLTNLWRESFAPLVSPGGRDLAQGRFDETIAGLRGRAGMMGERQAYQEWLRTQPSGDPLNIGQALLGTPTSASFQPQSNASQWGQLGLTAINAAGTAASVYNAYQTPVDTSAWQGTSTAPTSPYWSDRYGSGGGQMPVWNY